MSSFIESSFTGLPIEALYKNGPSGEFSPIEQVWHLADLEEEGFFVRIKALLKGTANNLIGFDGDKVALERNYKSLSFQGGLNKFESARLGNINLFQLLDEASWQKEGYLEGVGKITLCDMPSFLFQHDLAHKNEINAWKTSIA